MRGRGLVQGRRNRRRPRLGRRRDGDRRRPLAAARRARGAPAAAALRRRRRRDGLGRRRDLRLECGRFGLRGRRDLRLECGRFGLGRQRDPRLECGRFGLRGRRDRRRDACRRGAPGSPGAPGGGAGGAGGLTAGASTCGGGAGSLGGGASIATVGAPRQPRIGSALTAAASLSRASGEAAARMICNSTTTSFGPPIMMRCSTLSRRTRNSWRCPSREKASTSPRRGWRVRLLPGNAQPTAERNSINDDENQRDGDHHSGDHHDLQRSIVRGQQIANPLHAISRRRRPRAFPVSVPCRQRRRKKSVSDRTVLCNPGDWAFVSNRVGHENSGIFARCARLRQGCARHPAGRRRSRAARGALAASLIRRRREGKAGRSALPRGRPGRIGST